MGIIKKQSIQSTIIVYLGIIIGFFNAAILLPNLLNSEQKGLIDLINSYTSMFSSIFLLGVPLVTLKLFPKFRDKTTKHSNYFSLILIVTIIGFLLGSTVFVVFKPFIISAKNAARYYPNFTFFFIIILFSRIVFKNFDSYIRMLYKTVIGLFLENVIVRVIVLLILLSFAYLNYSFNYLFTLYSVALCISGLLLSIYLFVKIDFGLNFRLFKLKALPYVGEMKNLAYYGIIGSIGSIVVLHIDRIMLGNMIGASATGIYSTAFFFGLFIVKPSVGIRKVSGVVISDAWKNNDLKAIKEIYYKSCLLQLIISLYLFLGIWLNIDFLYELMRPEYGQGKYVVLFIGIAQIIDMATGTNQEIIASSKYYKYNTYFILFLLVLTIILNFLLIPIYGLEGAAIASLIAMFLINLFRFLFLFFKFQLQPFNSNSLIIVGIASLSFIIVSQIPKIDVFTNEYLNIISNIGFLGTILTISFWLPTYFFNLSPDINSMINKPIRKLFKGK